MASNLPEYTDLQRTRVVNRYDLDGAGGARSIGSTQPLKAEEKGLFEGLSVAQVIAGAGAAATSVLLASHLGVYGSVIGAAVSSVVTVIATQIYRRALTAGAKKLNNGLGVGGAGAAQATSQIENPYRSALEPGGGRGARTAPASYRERAAAERRGVQRKVVIASIVVAIAAVAVTAGVILFSTAGAGIGTKPTTASTELTTEDTATQPARSDRRDAAAGTATDSSASSGTADSASPSDTAATDGTSTDGGAGAGASDSSSGDSSTSGAGGTGQDTGMGTDSGTATGETGTGTTGGTTTGTGTTGTTGTTTATGAKTDAGANAA